MRSFFQHKYWTILLAVVALTALTVLAIGLGNVPFKDAQPIGQKEAGSLEVPAQSPVVGVEDISLQSLIVFWLTITLVVALIAALLSPEMRNRLIKIFLRVLATFWLVYYIMKNYGEEIASLFNLKSPPGGGNLQDIANPNVPPPVFVPPQPSPWISYIVSIVTVLLVIFVAWRMFVYWKRVTEPTGTKSLEEIAKIARTSLRDLASGSDSTDVIMNCYFRMSHVVADKRRLARVDSMTPGEFAERLEQSGLPGDAVRRLTRLFEAVRYGAYRSSQKDINEAVSCLTAILNYCGEPV